MRYFNKQWALIALLGVMLGCGYAYSAFATGTTCLGDTTAPTGTSGTAYTIGSAVVGAIFTAINGIMSTISSQFYENIVGNSSFQGVVNSAVIMYVAIYGVMIFFGLAHANSREVINRLIKVGIVYALLGNGTSGWTFFNTYVGNLFMGGMNELIANFAAAGAQGITAADLGTTGSVQLDTSSMTNMYSSLGMILGQKYTVTIVSLFSVCNWGFLMAIVLILALTEFVLMLVGVILTYIKSIIGLSFLFGIAPIFIIMILFAKSKGIFMGWVNQVIAFALTPVMLFAFLSFYLQIIQTALTSILYPTANSNLDYCWATWFQLGQFNVDWWRPSTTGSPVNGDYGGVTNGCNTTAPPINIGDVIYFYILCYLGKSFGQFVTGIAQQISGGIGPAQGSGLGFSAFDKIQGMAMQGINSLGRDNKNVQDQKGKAAGTTGKR